MKEFYQLLINTHYYKTREEIVKKIQFANSIDWLNEQDSIELMQEINVAYPIVTPTTPTPTGTVTPAPTVQGQIQQ